MYDDTTRDSDPGIRAIYVGSMIHAEEISAAVDAIGGEVQALRDPQAAASRLQSQSFDVGVLDIALCVDHFESLRRANPRLHWVALVKRETLACVDVRHLIGHLCSDYHTLPIDLCRLAVTLGHVAGMSRLLAGCAGAAAGDEYATDDMIANAAAMREVMRRLSKMAKTTAPVLITGESGTGKELAARHVHQRSPRAGGPFVAVNCGALPASLIHAELFGAERGAYTGAQQRRIGRIEAAHGGTLFLDEMGELPAELQACLLRVLQEGTYQRLGSSVDLKADVRIIAATNVNLEQAMAERRFREDLYFRLNVLRVEMPALRERPEDIATLADHFFQLYAHEGRASLRGFTQAALRALAAYHWPGNVRELANRVRSAVVLCEDRHIDAADLGLVSACEEIRFSSLDDARAGAEREALQSVLEKAGSNITWAARQMNISRPQFYRLMEKHGLARTPRAIEACGT